MIRMTCQWCGKIKTQVHKNDRVVKYCSSKCYGLSKRNGEFKKVGKYIWIIDESHPKAYNGLYIPYHRWLVEKKLGKLLDKSDDVHHINGDKTDNRIENLQVIRHSDHMRLERLGGNLDRWSKDYEKCKECGTTKRKHNSHGRCVNCHMRQQGRNKRIRMGIEFT